MKTILVIGVAVTLVAGITAASDARAEKASDLLNYCEQLDRSLVATGDYVKFDQTYGPIYCWAFISAIQQTSRFYDGERGMLGMCVPTDSSLTQLIKVFIAWGRRYPERLHQQAAASVVNALIEAFPCAKK